MVNYERKNLNIRRLLELGELNIRAVAQNKSLMADEYFQKVEDFLEDAPRIRDVLQSASELEEVVSSLKAMEEKLRISSRSVNIAEDTKIVEDLEGAKNALVEIGYNDLTFDFENIVSAIKKGELQAAEQIANKAYTIFNSLYSRLKSASIKKKFSKAQEEDVGEDLEISGPLLWEVLDSYDQLEENRKMRVLAVDDVSVVLNTITSVLSPYYEVFALKSGALVEKFLAHTTPELFLLDIEMSEISGFELVPIIRSFPEHKNTPIIFLTGNASYNNLKDAMALGSCDFITKPVKQDILLEKIKKNIVRKKSY